MAGRTARRAKKASSNRSRGTSSARKPAKKIGGGGKGNPTPPPPSLPPIPEGLEVVLQKNDWILAQYNGMPRTYVWIARNTRWWDVYDYAHGAFETRISEEIAAEIRRLVAFEKAALASRRTCNTSTNITPFTMQVTAPPGWVATWKPSKPNKRKAKSEPD